MPIAPFPINPTATAVAIAYHNARHIADDVLPPLPVGKQEFKYLLHNLGEKFSILDTAVGRTSRPNQVDFNATEETESTVNHGLDAPVPNDDIDNADGNYDPVLRATEGTTELLLVNKEKRVADMVHNPDNYPTGNKKTLTGTGQWSDASSSPIDEITNAADSLIIRPNVMVIGRTAFSVLVRHPQIVKAYHGNEGGAGIVPRKFLAELFELEDVLVGESWLNTAKKGQTVTKARVWGKHAALLHRNRLGGGMSAITTFGFNATWKKRMVRTLKDDNIGVNGGQMVRVSEICKEIICAPDLGYLLSNVVA